MFFHLEKADQQLARASASAGTVLYSLRQQILACLSLSLKLLHLQEYHLRHFNLIAHKTTTQLILRVSQLLHLLPHSHILPPWS